MNKIYLSKNIIETNKLSPKFDFYEIDLKYFHHNNSAIKNIVQKISKKLLLS